MAKISFRQVLPHLVAVIVFIVVSCAYFYPQLEGQVVVQGDIVSHKGAASEVIKYREETGEQVLWTNSMFSGMPTYMISMTFPSNLMQHVERASRLFIKVPIGVFIGGMIGFYILALVLGIGPWVAVPVAVAFALSTNNLVLLEAGHNSKIRALFSMAPMLAGVLLAYRKKYLMGGALFAVAFGVNLYVNHYQMTYYFLLMLAVYGFIELFSAIREGALKVFLKASAVLLIAAVVAAGSSAGRILLTQEYAEDTMRGKPILANNAASPTSSSATEGLSWDYAMNWSNGALDLLAGIIPRAAGGSGSERTGEGSALYQSFSQRGVRLSGDFAEPLYWGELPFTSGPVYYGAILIMLFLLGALAVPGKLKWWILFAVVATTIMSLGKHAEYVNRALYEYFPLYSKFRAPSSILTVTVLFIATLAVAGLSRLLESGKNDRNMRRHLLISGGVSAGLCLLLGLVAGGMFDFESVNDAQYTSYGYDVDAIRQDRVTFFRKDAFRSAIFIVLAAAALYTFLVGKLDKRLTAAAIGILLLFDAWGIGRRYMSSEEFVPGSQYERIYTPTDADRQILNDPDPHFRVHDLTTDWANSSARSYFHKTIGGYHAAKLQRYQDMIDYYISQGNQSILNMLNAKYFIVPGQNGGERAQRNSQAYGNAWFVDDIRVVESANAEIETLGEVNLRTTAVIHDEFEKHIDGFDPQPNGSIRLTAYAPDNMTYEVNTRGEQLAVFSEVWYGPDKGWKVFIDGAPVELIRANYLLRAARIPSGQHTLEMVFEPAKYRTGNLLSLATSSLAILALGYALFTEYRRLPDTPTAPVPARKKGPTSAKRATKRRKKGRK